MLSLISSATGYHDASSTTAAQLFKKKRQKDHDPNQLLATNMDEEKMKSMPLNQQAKYATQCLGQPPVFMRNTYTIFFICGISIAAAYSSFLFQSPFFSFCKGAGVNFVSIAFAAYAIPSFPLLIIQSRYDSVYDVQFGTAKAMKFRLVACQILMIFSVLILPFVDYSVGLTLLLIFLCGAGNGISFAAFLSLATSFTPKCTAYFLLGTGASPFFLLAFNLISGDLCPNEKTNHAAVLIFFLGVAFLTVINMFLVPVLLSSESGKYYCTKKDIQLESTNVLDPKKFKREKYLIHSIKLNLQDSLLENDVMSQDIALEAVIEENLNSLTVQNSLDPWAEEEKQELASSSAAQEKTPLSGKPLSWTSVCSLIRYPLAIVFLVNFCAYIVQAQLLRLPTDNMVLISSIFYIDSIATFFGRQFSVFKRPYIVATYPRMFLIALVRVILCIYFFAYLAGFGIQSDAFFIALYCLYAASTGYLGSLVYVAISEPFSNAADASRASFAVAIAATLTSYIVALWNLTVSPAIFSSSNN